MEIEVLGAHLLESADTRLTSLLVDGVLALDAGSLASSLPLFAQHKLRAILLTHQHFDHIRDIPMIGMSFVYWGNVKIYSIKAVFEALSSYLLNHQLYPDFVEWPKGRPAMEFVTLEPGKPEMIEGYSVLAIPMIHTVPAVGYQLTSPQGKKMLYTGDTGSGMDACWEQCSPDLLIVEVSSPQRWEHIAQDAKHLTPQLLQRELTRFRQLKGYLPSVLAIHLNPFVEEEIREELSKVAEGLGIEITVAREGMKLTL
jgi:ribonuclease BN (tRNA processing enzyme)